jgi:hypothetical protein
MTFLDDEWKACKAEEESRLLAQSFFFLSGEQEEMPTVRSKER